MRSLVSRCFCSALCLWGSAMLLRITVACSFLSLYSIPVHEHTSIIYTIYSWWTFAWFPLWIYYEKKLLWMFPSMAFGGGQTQGSFLPGKYLEVGLRGHRRQFSQVVVPVHTRTSKLHTSQDGLLGQQTLQQSLVCRMFITDCPWDQLLWKGAVGSKIGQRESEIELQCRPITTWGRGC